MFHLSDKKPDGIRISPIQNVDYIRHEGNFAEEQEWAKNNKFVGNFISSAEIKNACKNLNFLLYKTDNFGSIRNTEKGIEVTEKASLTTIAVALMLSDETMNHQPLIISGSNKFIQKVVDTAIFANLTISFADKRIHNDFRQKKEKKKLNEETLSPMVEKYLPNAQISSPLLQLLKQENSKMLDFACLQTAIQMCNGIFLINS